MNDSHEVRGDVVTSYKNAPTRTVTAGGAASAYRELGPRSGVPVVFLNHLYGALDNWDPRVVDGIAAKHHVITFDNRGVGASTGSTPRTIQEMAKDAVTFIRALLTFQDPKQFLFFTRTANGRWAGKEFLARLKERTVDRDNTVSPIAYSNQLKAIHRWGLEKPHDLSVVRQPGLVANGDGDRMVPSKNSYDLARRLPNAELEIYPDAGHGGIFQFHGQFVKTALGFLERQNGQ
ncbi:alpha/beta fold hydrolase [Streptomyces acidiscabies]|uniref:alpha/beta fold hydrolase n=1 Tax=Streptomyces acidiscabies TaxID=42234 RepID=UPI00073E6438|nr:alpha/beta hydrolase [Streptomyces acidiscabies]GAQ57575.1 putative aminoacrylate hydrolase RutD [Streptomyces acidiscabies]